MKAFTTIMTITTVLVGFTVGAPSSPEAAAAALLERQTTCENTACGDDVFCFGNRCANGCVNGFCSHP
ncbi:hypothetical protein PG996_010894 [Apiospora saccharicola]|uniref:Uncharacterized protein n=1 Tax=Apiospora saccharicola TaxID=335842 RepID=A0ABR1USZ8_9PEZI